MVAASYAQSRSVAGVACSVAAVAYSVAAFCAKPAVLCGAFLKCVMVSRCVMKGSIKALKTLLMLY